MIKLSDYLFKRIAQTGIRHVFLLPGGGCMHLVDSLGKCRELEPVCFLHEQGAAIAADAYSQWNNSLGVALVTTGPGGTNAITGVAGSWIDSIPVLIVSGQVKTTDLMGKSGVRQLGVQEVDICAMVQPVTKYVVTILDPQSIRFHFEKALFLSRDGRPGPVWLNIPLDVQGAMIEEDALQGFQPPFDTGFVPVSLPEKVKKVFDFLRQAKRPVILAGNGIRLSGALPEFRELVEKLKVPVMTTWKAMDFLGEDHPLFMGRPGSIAKRGANFIQQNADLLMVLGARLDLPQIGYSPANFARKARKVVVEIDGAELAKQKFEIDLGLNVSFKAFSGEMLRQMGSGESEWLEKEKWLEDCIEWKTAYPVVDRDFPKSPAGVDTYVFVDLLSDLLSPEDVLVPGSSGSCSEIPAQTFRVKEGQRILNSPGLGAMGFGLPAGIGACLASGRKRTIGIIGDGGLQHNIQELETLARLKLPYKLFVLNNQGYASIRTMQNTHFKGNLVCCDSSSGLSIPDTCKIAAAYGLTTRKILNHETLKEQVIEVLGLEGPVVCEVMVDPGLLTAPRVSSEVQPDGRIVSRPMEDLWPFLDREELLKNIKS